MEVYVLYLQIVILETNFLYVTRGPNPKRAITQEAPKLV